MIGSGVMLKLQIIGSGSSGNTAILSNGVKNIIIDAGINVKDVKCALNYDILSVKGVVITHRHL